MRLKYPIGKTIIGFLFSPEFGIVRLSFHVYLRRVQYVGRSLAPDLLIGHHCTLLGHLRLVPDGGQPKVTSCCSHLRGGRAKTSAPHTAFPS